MHSCEGPLPGFPEDPSSSYFPLTRASPAIEAIDLERFGVEWVDTPVVMVHPLPDGRAIALHGEVESTVASLEAVRPDLMEERIELFVPGFRRLALGRSVRPPERLERENPSPAGAGPRSGTASAAVHPGPGVHGGCGAAAARAVRADASWLRPRRRPR